MAMTLVSTVTVGSGGAASIEFTNIPQDGKDCLIVFSGRSDASVTNASMYFTVNSSASAYNTIELYGSGSSASSTNATSAAQITFYTDGASATSNTFGSTMFYISNYTSSSAKSISIDAVAENNATLSRQHIIAGNWTGTSAISSCLIDPQGSANLVQYSTASLYIIS